jgi:hypothetical protein
MTTFRMALTNLSALSVTDVQNNYDIDALPETLSNPQLPALLVQPIDVQDDRLFKEQGQGLQTVAFSGAGKTVNYAVTHLLIVAPTSNGVGVRSHLPQLVTLIDNYMSAIADDPTLNDVLIEPAYIIVEPGVFTVGGREFYGCAFRQSWLMDL